MKAQRITFPDGTVQYTAAKDSVPAGAIVPFANSAAPTGWTQITSYNNYAFRLVSGAGAGTGGSVNFTTAFASQTPAGSIAVSGGAVSAFTLTSNEMPSHAHRIVPSSNTPSSANFYSTYTTNAIAAYGYPDTISNPAPAGVSATGGGGSHTHGFTDPTATFTGTAINLAVKYVDMILAEKD